jgi:DNA-binding protein HU-beta
MYERGVIMMRFGLTDKKEEKAMTKAQLIAQMAEDADISKAQAGKALDSLFDGVRKAVKGANGRITLPGFGTFSMVRRKARQGVNPSTGEKITIKARNAVKFQPGKALKEAMS